MPKKFTACVRDVSEKLTLHPRSFVRQGHRVQSNAYAICRKSTGYYGPTRHKRR